jgi:chaperone required for assembly of F1-ATPase
MTPLMKKRFWREAQVQKAGTTWGVLLDGHPIRTPAKALLQVPSLPTAQAIAREWQAVEAEVDPAIMPVTRFANTAIDKVSVQQDAIVDLLAEYGGSDLLCYRAEKPQELIDRQAAAWDPVLSWAKEVLQTPLHITHGVMPVVQPGDSLAAFHSELQLFDTFEIAAVHDLVTLSGSLVLGLGVAKGYLSPQDAWSAACVDQHWQEDLWGRDADAVEATAVKSREFSAAHHFLNLVRSGPKPG